jgi:AraC-like DNA-binding protein
MDVLSDILNAVRLKGAVFYNAEFSAPWSFRSPPSCRLARYVASEESHIIVYHLVLEGKAWARLETGAQSLTLCAGDIVMFPHGDAHVMGNGSATTPVDDEAQLDTIFSQGLDMARMGGGGDATRFICGYMISEPRTSTVLLAGLPPILKVSIGNDPAGTWLGNSIRFSVEQARGSAPGADAVLAKLSEALFVETLRRYLAILPPSETGWLAGARDPQVGRALSLLHRQPARQWTLPDLAQETGVSRSVLAERFRHYLGEPPVAYLTRWRMALAARMLQSTPQSIAQIAGGVGYDSEAAFNRAFKRVFGLPPARFRRKKSPASPAAAATAAGTLPG